VNQGVAESAQPPARALVGDFVPRYRAWVTNHTVAAALLGGLIATHVASVSGFMMPGIGLPRLDWSTANGLIYNPKSSANVQFLSGSIFHYMDGIAFGVMFAIAVHPLMRRWRSTVTGNLLKGLAFGTALATISCVFMTPRVYYPDAHLGFFSHNLGWQPIFAIYLWHWIYGLQLGTIYNPQDPSEPAAAEAQR
jgi:hypothetical protein